MANEVQDRWREITGVAGKPAPSQADQFSGSGGDRERGKFRPSDFPRMYVVAVCQDDGTPIGEGTEALLIKVLEQQAEILTEMRLFNANFKTLLEMA